MNGVQCYELFGGIALKNHAFSFFHISRLARMSVLDAELDGSNPGSSTLIP